MISSIFYFADTEQEYLDNFNRRQVKPYTIVFCKDTHSLWKNGIRFGGSTKAEMDEQIYEAIVNDVQPLIDQLNNAVDQANQASVEAEQRLQEAINRGEGNLDQLAATVENQRNELLSTINSLNDQIKDKVEDLMGDSAWVEENWPLGVTEWQSGWDDNLEAYLSTVGYWDEDEHGNKVTKWSLLQQSADAINQSVNNITKTGGTLDVLLANLQQQITAEGTARTLMGNTWAQADAQTREVLEWMYSGLTTEAGENKSFGDLVAAAHDDNTDAISNINVLVEKVPLIDQNTGQLMTDEDGKPLYQKDANGKYIYRAKSSLTSMVNDSLAGLINEATGESASSQLVASVGDYLAGIKALADENAAQMSLIAGGEGDFSTLLLKDDLDTALGELAVQKGLASGSIWTEVENLGDDIQEATSGMATLVANALTSFEQKVTGQSAETTAVNKLGPALSGLVSKVTGDSSNADIVSKINNMTAGVITSANLEQAVAGLITEDENTSLASAILSKIDTAVGEATAQMAVKNDVSAASIVAKVNGAGSEINLNADKINFTGYANFENAVKAVDLDVLGLTQSDVNGIVQAKLEEGNATFSGDVVAKTLTAGDPNAMHITTEEGEIKFVNADGVAVARFVTNGNGLEIFLLDENGDEFYLDWSNWSSSAEYEVETFYELRYDAVEEHASIERIQLYLSDGEYYTKPNPNSRLTQQLNLYERIDDKSSVINNYSSQYGENQQVIYLKTTALKTTENYSSSCVQEIPISNVMTFKNVTVSSSGKQDTDIYVYATNFRMPEQPIPYTQFGLEINISNTSWKRVPQFISQPSTSVGTGCLVTIGEVIHNLLANTTIDAVKSCEVVTSLRPTSNRFTASVSYDSYPNQWNVVDN